MTEQEQIEEMMLDIPQTIVAYDANPKGQHLYGEQRLQIAEALYNAGYRKIMNGKELNSELDEEECDVVDDYTIGFATYLMQKRRDEVDRLQAEIKQLKTECALLDDELRIARQNTIDVLNKLKSKSYVNNYCRKVIEVEKIDEMIEELVK